MNMKTWKILLLVLLVISAQSCGTSNLAEERADEAADSDGDIIIGVAWPFKSAKKTLENGVDLAAAEINNSGGVLGRKLVLKKEDDERSVTKGLIIANKFSRDLQMVAVIGHLDSYISIPASSVYEFSGLLMLTPGSSGQELTSQGYKRVFRSIPNNKDQGKQLADYARDMGYKKIIIYYIRNSYGRDLANYFEQQASTDKVSIVDRRSYDKAILDFRGILSLWKDLNEFDAIFLAGSLPEAGKIISQAREVDIQAPVFGGAGLDSDQLIKVGGKSTEGTVVGSFFHHDDPRPEVEQFNSAYKKAYGVIPDSAAAQGYDSVMLLAYAMTKAGTTVPDKVAEVLRTTKDWVGVTGIHTFNEDGDVVQKRLVMKVVKDGKFDFLPPVQVGQESSVVGTKVPGSEQE